MLIDGFIEGHLFLWRLLFSLVCEMCEVCFAWPPEAYVNVLSLFEPFI